MSEPYKNAIEKPLLQTLEDKYFTRLALTVRVLRMDEMHPVISGNKWMKLQPWIEMAKKNDYHGIVTMGGPWSNHLHAAAYTSKQESLAIVAIVKGNPNSLTPMLQDALDWGAKLVFVNNKDYKDEEKWASLAASENKLFIPMGGEGLLAEAGVRTYINSLYLPATDYLLCPVGTGTTLKGIAASNICYDHLIGINPGINEVGYTAMITDFRNQYPGKTFTIEADSSLMKFGKWPATLIDEMNYWYERLQLSTDIVYTAKMFSIVMKMVNENYFRQGSEITLIHTGGLQGNRSVPAGLLNF